MAKEYFLFKLEEVAKYLKSQKPVGKISEEIEGVTYEDVKRYFNKFTGFNYKEPEEIDLSVVREKAKKLREQTQPPLEMRVKELEKRVSEIEKQLSQKHKKTKESGTDLMVFLKQYKNTPKKVYSFRIFDELSKKIDKEANKYGVSKNEIVNFILFSYFKEVPETL